MAGADGNIDGMAPAPASAPVPTEPRLSRVERRERAATDVLRTLIRDLQLDRFGVPRPGSEDLALTLKLKVKPGENWALSFQPSLAEQIARQIEEAEAHRAVYQPGRAYCFRCESAVCEHSLPPSSVSVFQGYTATGQPEWHDLHQGQPAVRPRGFRERCVHCTCAA